MNQKYVLINSILWASAIIASAIVGAPTYFTLILLPSLAAMSLLLNPSRKVAARCNV